MVKALQKKFVRVAMAAVTVLLIVMIGSINIWHIYSTYSDAKRMIHMLSDSGGMPQNFKEFTGSREDPDHAGAGENGQEAPVPAAGESLLFGRHTFTMDNAMSARFFYVRFSEEGTITETGVDHISSVTEEEARELAQEIYDGTKNLGLSGGFMFLREERTQGPEGQPFTIVVFMDLSSRIASVQNVFLITLCIGAASWLLMLLFVILLSGRAIRPIAENMERQKQFVTNAGHEIKTPLAIILANTEAMELIKGENKWTANIRTQVDRLSGLMQNLLTLAKMDETQLHLPLTELSVKEIIEETVQSFALSAGDKDIAVHMQLEDIRARGNYETVSQLIGILMDNAVKYTPKGGHIEWTVRRQGKYCLVEERNTVDTSAREDDPNRLFDRFYRSDQARTQKNGGYGIGLSAAKAIASANKGSIRAFYDGEKYIVFAFKLMV